MQNFEQFLLDNLPKSQSIHPTYESALQNMLEAGGKRFRPALLLGVVKAYNPLLVFSRVGIPWSLCDRAASYLLTYS